MHNKILQRIIRNTGVNNLFEILSKTLSQSDLQSLLMEVYQKRVSALSVHDILKRYINSRFFKPSDINPVLFKKLDLLAMSILPEDFEPIELSPVCPLGTCSGMATISQNNIISTIRNSELVSDVTNVLALECSLRRKELLAKHNRSVKSVKLCASHRLTRGQAFEEEHYSAHFAILSLCTAGQDEGDYNFEISHLKEHIEFYLDLLYQVLDHEHLNQIEVTITDFSKTWLQSLQLKVISPLKKKFNRSEFLFNQNRESGKNYYDSVCFQIHYKNKENDPFLLVDGGFTDWTRKIMNNNKERFLSSGIGIELLIKTLDKEEFNRILYS